MTTARRAPDAGVGAAEWNRAMDSFDTWPLVVAPLAGLLVIAVTLVVTALST
jgi:hypothetical protein